MSPTRHLRADLRDHLIAARNARPKLTPGGIGSEIEVAGQRIPHVRAVSLNAAAAKMPHLTLDFSLHEVDVEGEMVVTVPDKTRAALVVLGWTPPADEPGQVEPEPERSATVPAAPTLAMPIDP